MIFNIVEFSGVESTSSTGWRQNKKLNMDNRVYYIYKITNPVGACYIGFTLDYKRRFKNHKDNHKKSNTKLQASFKHFGLDNHAFEVIECCEFSLNEDRERFWQIYYDSVDNGLNTSLNNAIPSMLMLSKSGRKLKYGEELTQINARVPISRVKEFQDLILEHLSKYEVTKYPYQTK